ncbi:MAG: hypothetical protein GC168_08570 [Candidatus Hydrogenedens sp.]|nr:hypothetical protein [Candidatus Hydrogenedens sp.]
MSNKAVSSWHVGVAAEAFAAGLFARCGCDVSVQYGANQPEYDLVVVKGDRLIKVSVKGSQDGSWGLTQNHIKNANYHEAVDIWRQRHKPKTVFCFIQFKGVELDGMPRAYLAKIDDVADRLKQTAKGRGDSILYEEHEWRPHAHGAGTVDRIPEKWRFSRERVEQLLNEA